MQKPTRMMILLLPLSLLAACGGRDARVAALEHDMAQMERELKEVQSSIVALRTEKEELDLKIGTEEATLTSKLHGRIPGQDHLYLEIDAEQVAGLARGFFEGLSGRGEQGGRSYSYTLQGVRSRVHQDRILLTAGYTLKYGETSCTGPGSGYLLFLDRDLLKVQGFLLSCSTPQGIFEVPLGDELAYLPLPIGVQRRMEPKPGPGVKLPVAALEMVTPLQAAISPGRMVLRASTVVVRTVKP